MHDDDIRIRIPKHLKQRFKETHPHGRMTDLLKAVVITTLEGVNLPRLVKKTAKLKKKARVRTKRQAKPSNSYIRFLIDTDTKERFKLFCHLNETTMSNFLREAVEEILDTAEERPSLPQPQVRRQAIASRQPIVDIGLIWDQTFGHLSA